MIINSLELKTNFTCYLTKKLELNELIGLNMLDFCTHSPIYFFNDIKTILPELFFITSILILTIYGSILVVSSNYKYPLLTRNISWLCILVLSFTFLLTYNNMVLTGPIFTKTFINDDLSNYSKMIILLSSIACLVISQNYVVNNRINSFEYYLIILLSILGLLLLVTSYDLLSVYLALELQSLSFYILASFKRNSTFSTEAGLKYFILGAFASGIILFGISLIYGFTGSTNFECLSKLFYSGFSNNIAGINSVKLGVLFIIVGFLFKLAASPFHVWVPDVYEGSPTSSTAIFAILPKIAILVVLTRLLFVSFSNLIEVWQSTIIFSALFSVIIGSLVALKQRKVKKLIAYSSISHVGYMLISLSTGTFEGCHAIFFYILIYMITGICLWSIIFSVELENNTKSRNITDLSSLVKSNNVLAITTGLVLFSLAGVPPLSGFFAKLLIFISALESSLYFLALVGILSSVISTFYYIRIIKVIYFEKVSYWNFYKPISQMKSLILGCSFFLIVLLFYNPNLFILSTYKMSMSLFL